MNKDNIKVTFINPFWNFKKLIVPFNLLNIASFIEYNNFNTSIIDLNYELINFRILNNDLFVNKSIDIIKKEKTEFVCINCEMVDFPFCFKLIPLLKKEIPQLKIILFGDFVYNFYKKLFQVLPIDFIIYDKINLNLLDFLNKYLLNNSFENINDVSGLIYKDINENIKKNNVNKSFIYKNKTFKLPKYNLLKNFNNYIKKNDFEFFISCLNNDYYDNYIKTKYYNYYFNKKENDLKNIKNIINEIIFLKKKYQINNFSFGNFCLTNDLNWFNNLLKSLIPLNISISGFIKINDVNKNILLLMKNAGFKKVYQNINSGSLRLRQILNNDFFDDLTNEEIFKKINYQIKLNLIPICIFNVGIFSEEKEEFNKTIKFAKKLNLVGAKIKLKIQNIHPKIISNKYFLGRYVFIYKWNLFSQSNFFDLEQRMFFSKILCQIDIFNLDNYIFKSILSIEEFINLYKCALTELNLIKKEDYLLIKPPIEEIFSESYINKNDLNQENCAFFNHASQPYGLLKISSYLKYHGKNVSFINCSSEGPNFKKNSIYNVKFKNHIKTGDGKLKKSIFHCGLDYFNFKKILLKIKNPPNIIFITSTMTYHFRPVHKIIEICKKIFPNSLIIVGGIYASISPEHLLKTNVDFVFCGQFMDAENFNSDLDILDYKPDYAIIKSTRGCPNKCSYCAVHMIEGNKMFFRNYKDTFNEIKQKYDKGIKSFVFWESNLLINFKNHFGKILDLIIKYNLKVDLLAPEGLQPNLINYSLAKKMKKAGFNKISLPLETSDKKLELKLNRPSKLNFFKNAIEIFNNVGIKRYNIGCFILIGLPNQDIDDVINSLIIVWESGAFVRIMPFTPIPNTKEYIDNYDFLKNKEYHKLSPNLYPFSNKFFSSYDIEILSKFHGIFEPIFFYLSICTKSDIDYKIISKIKNSKKIWDNFYSNFKYFYWSNDIVDTIIIDFIKNINNNLNKKIYNNLNVLDIGCGLGRNSLFLEQKGFNVYGVDISKVAIDNLNKKIKNKTNFVVGNFLNVKYNSNFFDILVDIDCLSFLDKNDFDKYIKKNYDILKPGGILILRVFREDANYSKRFFLRKGFRKSSFVNYFTKTKIIKLFSRYFQIKSIKNNLFVFNYRKNKISPSVFEIIMKKF